MSAAEVRGVWRTLAPMPSARQEVGVAELNGKIYVIGGLASGGAGSARVDVFDPAQGSWQTGPVLPSALHHVAATSVGGKVYSIGGFSGSSTVDTVLALDLTTASWIPRAPLPTARGALAAAVIGGKIYAVGGSALSGNSRELAVYNPATDTWTTLAPMPTARNHHAAAAVDDKLYVVGGRSPNLGSLEVFDTAGGAWESRPSMPTARSGIAAAAVTGFLFVFGGESPGVFKEVEVFDPRTNSWFALDPMPVPRHGIGAAVVGNRIIIAGGATMQGFGATNATDELVALSESFAFAQFVDSREISTQIVLTNGQSEEANVMIELRDDSGADLAVNLGGNTGSKFRQTLAARVTETLATPGTGPATAVGGAVVFSDRPILANLLFLGPLGFAGVPAQRPVKSFLISVQRNRAAGVDSGVAVTNVSRQTNPVSLVLRDKSGTEIASRVLHLQAFGHHSQLLAELFPSVNLDSFLGSVAGSAQQDVAAMAILLRPNQMATVPVAVP